MISIPHKLSSDESDQFDDGRRQPPTGIVRQNKKQLFRRIKMKGALSSFF